MSHSIIVNGYRVFPFHDDGDGRVADEQRSVIEFGEVKYTPAHGMTNTQQAAQVKKILAALDKLGDHAE